MSLPPSGVPFSKGYSMDVLKQFRDDSLDFVFIDANHEFRHTIDDIDEWSRKVKKGGVVSGHDFDLIKPSGQEVFEVIYAVPAWTEAKGIRHWFVITGFNGPIWMWIK